MTGAAVVDASPVILLAKAGYLDLLRLAGEPVVVPQTVAEELGRHRADIADIALRGTPWLAVVSDPAPDPSVDRWDLGPGESAVLTFAAARPGTVAVLDDLAARRCALALRVPVRGTVGLVLAAKDRGLIVEARPILGRLMDVGMYLSDRVLRAALDLLGE